MDSTIDIKKRIHDFIDHADERILKIFNAIISSEEEIKTDVPEYFYEEVDKRRERHLKGESKSYNWEDVKNRARANSK